MSIAFVYTVLSGDTLSIIAKKISNSAGITTEQIETTNPKITPQTLQVGQQINIPFINDTVNSASGTWIYTILGGDSFASIASGLSQCLGLTYEEIEKQNKLAGSDIKIGQLLNIPVTNSANVNLSPTAKNMGYWDWTWSQGECPQNANLSIAFSGWIDVEHVLESSKISQSNLVGTKYLSFGGGNDNGKFSADRLNKITNAIAAGQLEGYNGVAYDVECGDSGLADDFAISFQAAKSRGLKVLVTVSHSAPYGIHDADVLMSRFFADDNIDILSPQLYQTGEELTNDYDLTSGTTTTWGDYATSKAAVILSIVDASFYYSALEYFEGQGVELDGYIQWKQTS